jgi:hypothetical protein
MHYLNPEHYINTPRPTILYDPDWEAFLDDGRPTEFDYHAGDPRDKLYPSSHVRMSDQPLGAFAIRTITSQ